MRSTLPSMSWGTVDIQSEAFAPRVKAGSKQPYIKGRKVQRAEIKEGD